MDYFRCNKGDCENDAQYVCLCLCSETLWCEKHLKIHLKKCNAINHVFDTISELSNITKDEILKFLTNENLDKEILKQIVLSLLHQNSQNPKTNYTKKLNELTSDLKAISDLIIKISKISEKNNALLLNSLALQPHSDAEKVAEIPQNNLDSKSKLFYRLGELRNKKLPILSKATNDLKTMQDFRKTCAFYENDASNWLISQAYKEYIKAYQKITSLYYIKRVGFDKIELFIYDTENEREWKKILENPCEEGVQRPKFIIQLSNGELLIHCSDKYWSTTCILDRNYKARCLPSWGFENFFTATYFNGSIYFFGCSIVSSSYIDWSIKRFDLHENIWINLAPITEYDAYGWRSIIFNRNILVTRACDRNILLYSIDIDSFSTIPYEFERNPHKILINTEERLYLIECGEDAWIYESEVGNMYVWNWIAESILKIDTPDQIYCSYNKGDFYILVDSYSFRAYFKFDLGKKDLVEIACYTDKLAIKNSDGKLKAIKCDCYNQTFKLDSDYIKSGYTLYYIAGYLDDIENLNYEIKRSNKNGNTYRAKGDIFHNLGWNIEAIKYYNKAIKLDAYIAEAYIGKGNVLHELDKNLEALECYNNVIKLKFETDIAYFRKAVVLHCLGRYFEATECYNIAIKLNPDNFLYFCHRANLLNDLEQEEEAKNDFNRAHDLMSKNSQNIDLDGWLNNDCVELLEMLSKLLETTVTAKEELQIFRDISQSNSEILNEAKKNESIVKEQRSQLIKKALELFVMNNKPIKKIEQIKREVSDLEKATIDIPSQINLLLFSQS